MFLAARPTVMTERPTASPIWFNTMFDVIQLILECFLRLGGRFIWGLKKQKCPKCGQLSLSPHTLHNDDLQRWIQLFQ